LTSLKLDLEIDMGNPLLNLTIDGFLPEYVFGVGDCKRRNTRIKANPK
jgi:hypothetical protein